MGIYYDQTNYYSKEEKYEDLPQQIKDGIIEECGENVKNARIISVSNDYHKIDIRMDNECYIFTSPEKTYLVISKIGSYSIYI